MAEWNEILRAARRQAGLSQPALAVAARCSPGTVQNAEYGRKRLSREALLRLIDALTLAPAARNAVLVGAGHDPAPAGRLAEIERRRRPLEELQAEVDGYAWPCLVMNERHEIACWNAAANAVAELDFARDLPLLRDRSLMRISTMAHFRARVQNWEQVISVLIAVLKANQTDIERPQEDSAYFMAMVAEIAQRHPDIFPTLIELWQRVEPRPDGGREGFPAIWRLFDGTVLRFVCLIRSWSDFDAAWSLDWHPADAATWTWLNTTVGAPARPAAAALLSGGGLPLIPRALGSNWRQLLRQEREATGLSRAELASRSGVSQDMIYSLEARSGRRRPTRETLLQLTRAMELDGIATNAILEAAGVDPEPSEWALFLANEERRSPTRKYRPKNNPHRTRLDVQRAIAAHAWPCLVIDERCTLLCWNEAADRVFGEGYLDEAQTATRDTIVQLALADRFRAATVNWEEVVAALIPSTLRPFLGPAPAVGGGRLAAIVAAVRRLDAESRARLNAVWQDAPAGAPQTRVVFPLYWRTPDGAILSFTCLLSPWNAFDPAWALDWHPADAATWRWLNATP